ncbi:MAG TPA: hypothetical protein ENN13_03835 [Candidatus Altiarchaeales archaeon]|nr:hypothetical protein [Candidatus Altiarchaeales archaeon]
MKNHYQKGAGFERELVTRFWEAGWSAVRVAGSGSTPHPVPDVIAVRDGRTIAVECKTTTGERLSLKSAVAGLREFQKISGCTAYIAVKFSREKPRFYTLDSFESRGNHAVLKSTEYLDFETVSGRQKTLQGKVCE